METFGTILVYIGGCCCAILEFHGKVLAMYGEDYLKFALKPLEPLRLDPCLMAPMCQGPSISHTFSQSWSPG